jgi:tRNA (mo5U34)-methyltransferase
MIHPVSKARRILGNLGKKASASLPNKAVAPEAPLNFNPEIFFKNINWYQKWEVFSGIFTPGINPVFEICELMKLQIDLSGRRVLDIGSDNGCMSLECERRGAAEVVGLTPRDGPEWGHNQLREVLGATKTQFIVGSVYDLNPKILGYFDTVLFCGVLYHLRYPMLAIDNIRRVATGDVFIETHVSDYALHRIDKELPLWKFYRRNELNKDWSNWFGPNTLAVLEAFESAGFSSQMVFNNGERASFNARVRDGMPEFLDIRSHEARSYDLLLGHLFGDKKEDWSRPVKTGKAD